MSRAAAVALWGPDAVRRALGEHDPEPVTDALAAEVQRQAEAHADDPGALARWALGLPWPRFCAVVRIVAGDAARDLLGEENA